MEVPTISKFKVGLCQLTVNSDKNQNLLRARNLIKVAAHQGARLVVLPEMWNCPYSAENFAKYGEDFNNGESSPSFSMLSEVASCYGITIVGGSIPEWCNGRLYNTCCVFGSDGKLKAKHRKVSKTYNSSKYERKIMIIPFLQIHLFDIDVPGDISFKESDSFAAGDEPTIVDTDIGRIGIGICHDMRFPELAMLYRAKGARIICYPGAFNMSTGELLWELVQRARAADNQLFVATCSPSRDSAGCYKIWGHSTVVSAFGEIIATSEHEEMVVVAEIDYSEIQLRRESLPLEKQRRADIYQFIDMNHSRA
ncbi:hypothetical protein REPUB_Repub14bG0071700 [Reevesia pubescens]